MLPLKILERKGLNVIACEVVVVVGGGGGAEGG